LSRIIVNPGTPEERVVLARDGNVKLGPGDVLRIEQAGGGGYGDPHLRPVERVLEDVREGYVSQGAARQVYGVVVWKDGAEWRVDAAATGELRGAADAGP
jgi:N-methylhydantoinase B